MQTWRLLVGDVRDQLRTLPDASVHRVVTSPPYWGLRDYGVEGQIGLEESPADYLATMVAVFAEVQRVLRGDGTCWVNLGDTYNTGTTAPSKPSLSTDVGYWQQSDRLGRQRVDWPGLKRKDLCGIPWRVAFALQEAGWYLRRDVVWHKTNPMPEAVNDRPANAHEYVFLLSKRERYFYDAEAVKERVSGTAHARGNGVNPKATPAGSGVKQNESFSAAVAGLVSQRNARSVWTFQTQAYDDAHFATFPEELPARCIKAGTSEHGCCATCGAPYERVVELGDHLVEQQRACGGNADGEYSGRATKDYTGTGAQNPSDVKRRILDGMRERKTVGWLPTCACAGAGIMPCTVLDPFTGSGTTGDVALRLGRSFIGIELNPTYANELARPRLMAAAPLFAAEASA